MANIALRIATAHGPQLTIPPETWDLRLEADRANVNHWFRGEKYNFGQFAALRCR
jgi:hypothetical protein